MSHLNLKFPNLKFIWIGGVEDIFHIHLQKEPEDRRSCRFKLSVDEIISPDKFFRTSHCTQTRCLDQLGVETE